MLNFVHSGKDTSILEMDEWERRKDSNLKYETAERVLCSNDPQLSQQNNLSISRSLI